MNAAGAVDIGRRQAEAIAGAMHRVTGTADDTLATFEARLMHFYFGASIAQVAVIVGLLKLL